MSKHHLIPRSRGGTNDPDNIMMIEEDLHHKWHMLFGNQTISQIITMLEKIRDSHKKTTFIRKY